jgi:hypothetical protein
MLCVLKNWSLQHRISVLTPKLGYQAAKEVLPKLIYFISLQHKIMKKLKVYLNLLFRILFE